MLNFDCFLPRSRAARALVVTVLYALLALFVLHAPIGPDAPFARLFGGPDPARDMVVGLVRGLFWPLVAVLFAAAWERSLTNLLQRLKLRR
jgi:hypothetical protein